MMEQDQLKAVLEALFAAADRPLSVNSIFDLFSVDIEAPTKDDIRKAIHELTEKYQSSGLELKQVASGFRLQVKPAYETWVTRLWDQKPPRYSRALMETLALIAYRQPITRGEIEDIRGVSVSTNIIKTLREREWVKPLGHKDVPGKPTLYGTSREFLDYFNLKTLNELPTLAEIRDLDQYNPEFVFADEGKSEPAPVVESLEQ
jgi:segregation and condensation protein B